MAKSCTVQECLNDYHARGLCKPHYMSARSKGTLPAAPTPEERFWSKVDKTQTCWNWTSAHDGRYGNFSFKGRKTKAHRLSFEWANGPIPLGMQVDHICWNTHCVKPSHLRLANQAENNQNLSSPRPGTSSGVRGVYWSSHHKKWRAQAGLNGENNYLGGYEDINEAAAVVAAWRREHMPFSVKDQAA